ncbi:MAG: nucleotidyltransferase family protein [Longimonas sp.]|uniref:nucleotidyltransferase domain-containing protein n=1 Tax=Longimonas sp. TaxID=2039626 RepID=UPI003363DC68
MSWSTLSSTASPWHTHPHEIALVRACAAAHTSPERNARIQTLLTYDLDWEVVLSQARRHGVEAMLLQQVHDCGSFPDEARATLHAQSRMTAHFNMHRLHVLLQFLQRCDQAGCRVVSFKGAVLAQRYYGNLAFRRFADLDVLVAPHEVPQVKAILHDMGFESLRSQAGESQALEAQIGIEMRRAADQVVVEIHTELINKTLAYPLYADGVLARAVRTPIGTQSIYTMAPDDLLLYLCAHGTKHHWARLKWVADVAHMLHHHPDLDAEALCCRAADLHCERVLLLGVHVAARWLDTPIHDAFAAAIARDPVVGELAHYIETSWLCTDAGLDRTIRLQQVRFFSRTRRRWRDRWPIWGEYMRRSLEPSERDRAFADLPTLLTPLYLLVRPARVVCDWLGSAEENGKASIDQPPHIPAEPALQGTMPQETVPSAPVRKEAAARQVVESVSP